MQLVLSHRSAFLFWRAYTGNARRLQRIGRTVDMANPAHLTTGIREELASLGIFPTAKNPLDLLFSRPGARPRGQELHPHTTLDSLPDPVILQVTEHIAVVSPELCFFQLAAVLPRERLVLASYEFTGTYAQVGANRQLQERPALTTTQAIRAFAALLPRTATATALKALDFVLDGAASPMEAKTAMLLTLPTSWGGYGLLQPALNPELAVSSEARRLYPHATVRPDLYWADARFALEYDGDVHEADDTHARDVARLGALAAMDVEVLTLSASQIYDAAAFHQAAQVVAGRLGRRIRIRREDFPVRVTHLREELGLV